MVKKGKKEEKKRKEKQGKAPKEYDPPLYDLPEYQDPDIVTPKVNLIIKLANPINEVLTLKLHQVPITTRLEYIKQKICEMHQGAINHIKICRDRYSPEETLDNNKTLQQCGIVQEDEIRLFYDFKPVVNPLLV
ncbi:hypothetical protein IMG5_113900 [Ichthyophthirius multifiliis]|uniref:Ubiquitin-like domain-containing protein n=1 Tax=Ichthyophthirius multifiliis TaxID=5932 RepID=G0QU13_ICHMU|nr:hypothetical protein IMG5_113900 [Ichthyophthirius multifiliis]EGR31292.1 hypothetical protein IMG5_113900 [Ichthyophthirius multifiliis]|eukprot:XP_004034778.1 hypothetical protein IMG5_113900 [Ichthyophthirius multifiliis]